MGWAVAETGQLGKPLMVPWLKAMTAKLLPGHTNSQSIGYYFQDTDGFYIGPGMRAQVDIGSVSHTCVVGPIYYRVYGIEPTVNVTAGPSVC